jgi:hypothetical protein
LLVPLAERASVPPGYWKIRVEAAVVQAEGLNAVRDRTEEDRPVEVDGCAVIARLRRAEWEDIHE